jgi:poly-gamma-glutamate synthesis protein (capsule biosynthesis protein)
MQLRRRLWVSDDHQAERERVVNLVALGDVQPNREQPEELFDLVQEHLQWGDVRVCQLEATLSTKGSPRSDVQNPAHRVHPRNIAALTAGKIDVVTFAGNNNMDYGVEAFDETIELCRANGIEVVGAGQDVDAARAPVFKDVNGTRIAFVNFCSILREGYAATVDRPGISPLHVSTFYEPLENIYEQPGTPSRTVTVVDHKDLEAALDAIRLARQQADVVVASFHWGVHFTHDLAGYQPDVAYAAIDAGADLVLGTHPHCLQAIDVYRGKFIFYSLGNFAFEQPEAIAQHGVKKYLTFYRLPVDPELPQHPHPSHCRSTVLAKFEIRDGRIERASVVPVYFNEDAKPEPLEPGMERYASVVGLLTDLCEEIGTSLEVVGSELEVSSVKANPIDTRAWARERVESYPWLRRLTADEGPARQVQRV